MATTLTYNTTTVTLPDELHWEDEFSWTPVEQTTTYTTTGALLVESAAKQAGRPITLLGGDNTGWLRRSVADTLKAWAALPGIALTLVLRGQTYSVCFDHSRGGGFEAKAVAAVLQGGQSVVTELDANGAEVLSSDLNYFTPRVSDPFVPTLRFLQLA